jgi:hypothetical protein
MVVPAPVFDAEPIDFAAPQAPSPWEPPPAPAAGANWQGGVPDFGPSAGAGASDPGMRTRRPCPQCGERIIATAGKCRFCGAIFDPGLRGRGYRALAAGRGQRLEYARQIPAYFAAWWACLLAGAVIVVACVVVALAAETPEIAIGAIPGVLVVFAGGVCYLILLYKLWSVVQDGRAQTTPGAAVGLMFIPCFNIYWQFVAFWGLSKELNRISREYGFSVPEANEQLALTACILHCCGIIPYLGALASLAGMILSFIAAKNMCDVAVAIIRQSTVPTV